MAEPGFVTSLDDSTSLGTAKAWLRKRARDKGAHCPCCRQWVKVYKRALNSQMARWLIWLVRTSEQQMNGGAEAARVEDPVHPREGVGPWVDIKRSPVRGGDYAKLIHWGLVEHKPNLDKGKKKDGRADTRDSGMWRPTYKGIDFVYRRVVVPSHVYLYDGQKIYEERKMLSIIEALGERFSYEELMNAVAPPQARVPA